jgi:hypothetical protein
MRKGRACAWCDDDKKGVMANFFGKYAGEGAFRGVGVLL